MGITPGTSLLTQQTGHPRPSDSSCLISKDGILCHRFRWLSDDAGEDGVEEIEVEVEVEAGSEFMA